MTFAPAHPFYTQADLLNLSGYPTHLRTILLPGITFTWGSLASIAHTAAER